MFRRWAWVNLLNFQTNQIILTAGPKYTLGFEVAPCRQGRSGSNERVFAENLVPMRTHFKWNGDANFLLIVLSSIILCYPDRFKPFVFMIKWMIWIWNFRIPFPLKLILAIFILAGVKTFFLGLFIANDSHN